MLVFINLSMMQKTVWYGVITLKGYKLIVSVPIFLRFHLTAYICTININMYYSNTCSLKKKKEYCNQSAFQKRPLSYNSFTLGCSLSCCFRVYLLQQTRFKPLLWFLNYLFFLFGRFYLPTRLEEVQNQDLYITRAVSKDHMSSGQIFHFCTTHPTHPQKTNKTFDCQIRTQHTNPLSVVKLCGSSSRITEVRAGRESSARWASQ